LKSKFWCKNKQISSATITNEFGRALDEGKEVRVVFYDISKRLKHNIGHRAHTQR
jgi:hypothetical protein